MKDILQLTHEMLFLPEEELLWSDEETKYFNEALPNKTQLEIFDLRKLGPGTAFFDVTKKYPLELQKKFANQLLEKSLDEERIAKMTPQEVVKYHSSEAFSEHNHIRPLALWFPLVPSEKGLVIADAFTQAENLWDENGAVKPDKLFFINGLYVDYLSKYQDLIEECLSTVKLSLSLSRTLLIKELPMTLLLHQTYLLPRAIVFTPGAKKEITFTGHSAKLMEILFEKRKDIALYLTGFLPVPY